MTSPNRKTFIEKTATVIVDKRVLIMILFVAMAVFCFFSSKWVSVIDSLSYYLSDDTETRQGLDIMENEFTTFGVANFVIENITVEQAEYISDIIVNTPGVNSVDFDESEKHYKDASAFFKVTFDSDENDEISINALNELREMLDGYDCYIDTNVGNPLKEIVDREMLVVDGIAVIIITVVLLLTSRTYAEIPVLLITFGAAALLNMGTNYMMGEISFVSDSVAIVLQLALAIDYAIILCHRFTEEHETKPAREAAISALTKAIPEISASSLTTVSGLLALTFMQYRLGFDVGLVMVKAILLSLLSVFTLMPGLLVMFSKAIDKTHHKSFIPKITLLGKFAYKTRFVMPVLFVLLFIAAIICSGKANYVYNLYSVESIRKNDNQIALRKIDEIFGRTNQMALIVPCGDYEKEEKLIADIEELPITDSVVGLANIEAEDGYFLTSKIAARQFAELTEIDYEVALLLYTGYAMSNESYGQIVTNPSNYSVPLMDMFDYLLEQRSELDISISEDTQQKLDDLEKELSDAKKQLLSDNWTRIIVETEMPIEGDESFSYLNVIHGIMARYYSTYYAVGDTTSCYDLEASFVKDNILISVLSVLFVIIVLIFTFKSVGLPVLLILIIQGSICCNFSVPYLKGDNLYFLTYLLINAIQMGANIDYAIVISSRYMELKHELPLKEAMIETLSLAFTTIITSGTILAASGFAIGFITSNETISAIGIYLGTGTVISIFLVLCVLPQILLFGDIVIEKTSFNFRPEMMSTNRVGITRINGRVRGHINGYIDAEIHGLFRGELNAAVYVGNSGEIDESIIPTDEGGNNNEV